MPFASSNYEYYRNVMDYGAKGDGTTDDTVAINLAASSGDRCGQACGSTKVTGALVYFPPGIYLISSPIIQYYYTQFFGNPSTRPTIKGSADFSGFALIDSDVYICFGDTRHFSFQICSSHLRTPSSLAATIACLFSRSYSVLFL